MKIDSQEKVQKLTNDILEVVMQHIEYLDVNSKDKYEDELYEKLLTLIDTQARQPDYANQMG